MNATPHVVNEGIQRKCHSYVILVDTSALFFKEHWISIPVSDLMFHKSKKNIFDISKLLIRIIKMPHYISGHPNN